jgi:hypothetical protein
MFDNFLARATAGAKAAVKVLTDGTTKPAPTTPSLALTSLPTVTGAPDLITIKVDGLAAAKASATWLTKGIDRRQPTTAVLLVDCTTDHLKNIVANKPNLSADYRRVIESILEDRGETLDVVDAVADDHDDVTTDLSKNDPF